jgi:hypothetical protein
MSWMRHRFPCLVGGDARIGLAVVWFLDRVAVGNHRPGILSTNGDYRAASCIVAFFAVGALLRSTYKSRELLPLAVIYVAAVGAFVGSAVGAAIIGGWTEFVDTMPIKMQAASMLVGALGGVVINLRAKYGRGYMLLGTARLGYFRSRGLLGEYLGDLVGAIFAIICCCIALYYLIPFAMKFAATDGFSNATGAIWLGILTGTGLLCCLHAVCSDFLS